MQARSLLRPSLTEIIVPPAEVHLSLSPLTRAISFIITDAEEMIQEIVVREIPTSSNAINRQLDRVSHAVNVLITALQSSWDRNERLDLQTGLLQHMFSSSVIDRQELRDLFIRQRTFGRD